MHEKDNAAIGLPARFRAKMNSLSDPEMIDAIYDAADGGVKVELLVRGICCLRVRGHENIEVRSIVGRFLEHSRVYYFHANGDENLFCSSADWMDRNFFRRIEVCFPILDERLKSRILADLDANLSDNCQAWELRGDGSYQHARPAPGAELVSVQSQLLTRLADKS
jgi:polyphosphate kinase